MTSNARRTVKCTVKPGDVKNGKPSIASQCPLAIALTRTVDNAYEAYVYHDEIVIMYNDGNKAYFDHTGESLTFIHNFDNNRAIHTPSNFVFEEIILD